MAKTTFPWSASGNRLRSPIPIDSGHCPVLVSDAWRNVKAGMFPAPVKLSDRVTAWRVEDIRAWMKSRAAA